MVIKIKKEDISSFFFVLFIFVNVFTSNYESAGVISYLKYIFCVIGTLISGLLLLLEKGKPLIFFEELKKLLEIVGVILVITLIRIISTESFTMRTLNETIFLILPMIYSFLLLNTLSYKKILSTMKILLLLSIFGYFYYLNLSIPEFLRAITQVDYSNSYSALESSTFSGFSIAIALFFLYYRKNFFWTGLSVFFVFLTFKRLAILFVLIMLFLPYFLDCKKKVDKNWIWIIKLFLFALSIGYFYLMTPTVVSYLKEIFKFDMSKFTMSRTWRLKVILRREDFVNTGLGSTFTYLMHNYGVSLEMDIIKLLIEVTPIGVFVLINNLIDVAKRNWFNLLIMVYMILNMITSHSLTGVSFWVIIYVTMGSIVYLKKDGLTHIKFLKS